MTRPDHRTPSEIHPPSPLQAHLQAFLTHLSLERGLSDHTVSAYDNDCRAFLAGLPEAMRAKPEAIAEPSIFDYLIEQRRAGKSVVSVKRGLSALRTFFRFLVQTGVTAHNPTRHLESPRSWVRLPTVLQVEQVHRLLDAVTASDTRYPLRDAALLELMYATGLRVGEVTSLKLDSLRPNLGILRCLGKGSKERIVPVTRRAIAAIDRYLETERPRQVRRQTTEYLFVSRGGKPLGREVVAAMLRKYALLAGLPIKVTPHTLRHSFATHLLRGGADLRVVQELLGHAKVETTEVYTHLSSTDLKAAHQKFHPRG
jgi:integrase/recombinase XerD